MALSGTRLTTNLTADILIQLQALFPVNASLLPNEKTAYAAAQAKLAEAVANAAGPDVVTEVTGNAVVNTADTGSVTSGIASGDSVVATGIGTVT